MPHAEFAKTVTPTAPQGRRGGFGQLFAGLLLAGAILVAYFWLFPDQFEATKRSFRLLYAQAYPCTVPETYSLGSFDKQFNISRTDFLAAVQKAQHVWEAAAGKPLFRLVDANGALAVNLIYDDRQKATDKLRKLGVHITTDKAGYDRLKAEHDTLVAQLEPLKASFDSAVSAHEARVASYEKAVASWNANGGAPENVYEQLNAERAAIDAEAVKLNAQRDAINAMVDRINANVEVLNRLAKSLNLTAETYNGVSASRGAEFEEGLFTGTRASGKIDIYEFDDRERLVRLLTHEIGHALGLDHVDDPNAVMYRLNTAKNLALTAADVAELKRVCHLK